MGRKANAKAQKVAAQRAAELAEQEDFDCSAEDEAEETDSSGQAEFGPHGRQSRQPRIPVKASGKHKR